MWAGYAFAKDFREERGHAYMLDDQIFTERQQVAKQPWHVPSMPRFASMCPIGKRGTVISSKASRR
jgi:formate-dependent nitrite reductase cytochrome c552 subunit